MLTNSKKNKFKVTTISVGIFLCVNLASTFLGATEIGVIGDDYIHSLRLKTILILGAYGSNGAEVYGPFFSLTAHLFNVLFGQETFGTVSQSLSAYTIRHLTVAGFGVIGLLSTFGISKLLFKSTQWAVIATATLSSIPLWTGHSMMNIKDIPVAAGVSLGFYGLVRIISEFNFDLKTREPLSKYSKTKNILIFGLGITIAVGTRIGIWPIFFLAVLSILFYLILVHLFASKPKAKLIKFDLLRSFSWQAGLGILAAYLALLAIYPKVFSNPIQSAISSVRSSADFEFWDGSTLVNGLITQINPPRWYIPVWFVNQVPLGILIFSAIGLLTIGYLLFKNLKAKNFNAKNAIYLLVIIQALAVPVAAIILKSNLYGGIRQILLIFPGWAIIATVGMWAMFELTKRIKIEKFHKTAVALVSVGVIGSLIMPTYDQLRLFPYNYTYFNEIATRKSIDQNWDTDRWGVSFLELYKKAPKDGEMACKKLSYLDLDQFGALKKSNCSSLAEFGIYLKVDREGEEQNLKINEIILLTFATSEYIEKIPNFCEVVDSVNRPLRGQTIHMSYLALCDVTKSYINYQPNKAITFGDSNSSFLYGNLINSENANGVWISDYSAIFMLEFDKSNFNETENLIFSLSGYRLVPNDQTRPLQIKLNDELVFQYEYSDLNQSQNIEFAIPEVTKQSIKNSGLLKVEFLMDNPVVPANEGLFSSWDIHSLFIESVTIKQD